MPYPDKPNYPISKAGVNTRDLYAYVEDALGFFYRRVKDQEAIDLINNPKPKFDTIQASQNFVATIGGSLDLNVDGSVTPVEYTIAPVGSDILYVSGISIWLEDKGTWFKDTFGTLPELTNGVLIELGRDTTFTEIGNFINNFDISSTFSSGQAISLKDISGEIAIIGTQPLDQKRNIRLDGSNNDSLRVTVRDTLTGLDNFSLKAMMWKDE